MLMMVMVLLLKVLMMKVLLLKVLQLVKLSESVAESAFDCCRLCPCTVEISIARRLNAH